MRTRIGNAAAGAELKERYAAPGLRRAHGSVTEFADYIRDDLAKWRKVVRAAKLPPQESKRGH